MAVAQDFPVPPGLTDRLVGRLRERLHVPDGYVEIGPVSDRGTLQVAGSVIADVARTAAARRPGVLVVAASLTDGVFSLDLVIDYGLSSQEVAADARRTVSTVLEAALGVAPVAIDVTVVDVLVPAGLDPEQ